MKVNPIDNLLAGERVLDIDPVLSPNPSSPPWRRRPNLFSGRTLDHRTLAGRQDHHAGLLGVLGRVFSPGVVSGLEVTIESPDTEDGGWFVNIGSGIGLTASGEDVVIPVSRRVAVEHLRVFGPLSGGGADTSWALHESLGELLELPEELRHTPLPSEGVLVIQPVVVDLVGEEDTDDPCEIDPRNDAFENWQTADGCRVVLYAWPGDALGFPTRDQRWRSDLAYQVFNVEHRVPYGQGFPWERVGVPIALVGMTTEGEGASRRIVPMFVDRFGVARSSGPWRRRTPIVKDIDVPIPGTVFDSGSGTLWDARYRQFIQHMVDLLTERSSRPGDGTDDPTPGEVLGAVVESLRFIPPGGVLPKEAIAFDFDTPDSEPWGITNHFFPSTGFDSVEVVPIPTEQLPLAVRDSMGLSPYDVDGSQQRVQVLVPVPQEVFEPRLLHKEFVDPVFQHTLDRLEERRAKWLRRREDLRDAGDAIVTAMTATPPEHPPIPDDTDSVDPNERIADDQIIEDDELLGTPEAFYGTDPEDWADPSVTRTVALYESFKAQTFRPDTPDAPNPFAKELDNLNELGLEKFIERLESITDQADDKIDFGFTRVKVDIYRIRQHVLDNAEATRMATSPALAEIAKGFPATITQQAIQEFVTKTKLRPDVVQPADITRETAPPTGTVLMTGTPPPAFLHPVNTADLRNARVFSAVSDDSPTLLPLGGTGAGFISATTGDPTPSRTTVGVRDLRVDNRITTLGLDRSDLITEAIQVKTVPKPTQSVLGQSGLIIPGFSKDDIINHSAIPGLAYEFRTVSIDQRLNDPVSLEARTFGVASQFDIADTINQLNDLGMCVDDVEIHGVPDDIATPDPQNPFPKRTKVAFSTFKDAGPGLEQIRARLAGSIFKAPPPSNADEGAVFADASNIVDHTVATLRSLERRVRDYRALIRSCGKILSQLNDLFTRLNARLSQVTDHLAEARHDVAVVDALIQEERQRIDTINAHRREIIEQHVRFVAFRRPRTTSLINTEKKVPVRTIEPGNTPDPVPNCFKTHPDPPPEIADMVDVLREAPIGWFTIGPGLLKKLSKRTQITQVAAATMTRVAVEQVPSVRPFGTPVNQSHVVPSQLMQSHVSQSQIAAYGMYQAIDIQRRVMTQRRSQVVAIDPVVLDTLSWNDSRQRVERFASLGDLSEATHQHPEVAREAKAELEKISDIASCLYEGFSRVPGTIRLQWVLALSQFDNQINLRDLWGLQRWGQVEFGLRQHLQTLVDWVYSRVNPDQDEPVSMITDLVRICILLASHAPVDQIISGQLVKDTPVTPGRRFDIKPYKPSVIQAGMAVSIYRATQLVGKGFVEDLAADFVSARITDAFEQNVIVTTSDKVRFSYVGL